MPAESPRELAGLDLKALMNIEVTSVSRRPERLSDAAASIFVITEDIDRIEVISGPGGTLWGVNAVNGVINIITLSANATRGGLVSAGGGNRETIAALRYGGERSGRQLPRLRQVLQRQSQRASSRPVRFRAEGEPTGALHVQESV